MIVNNPERNHELITTLCEIWLDYIKASHPFLNEWHVTGLLGHIKEKVANSENLIVMYDESSTARGFVAVDQNKMTVLALRAICRGKGYDAFLIHLATDDFNVCEVDVYEKNQAGREFYESLGYKEVSRSQTDIAENPLVVLHLKHIQRAERLNPLAY